MEEITRFLLQIKSSSSPSRYVEIEAFDDKDAVKVFRKKYGGEASIQVVWRFVS